MSESTRTLTDLLKSGAEMPVMMAAAERMRTEGDLGGILFVAREAERMGRRYLADQLRRVGGER